MCVSGVAINTTMFTALVTVHGIGHAHIRTCNLVNNSFGKDRNVLGSIVVSFLTFDTAEF
jgi:hypothetical protein